MEFSIRPKVETDQEWVRHLIRERWGDEIVIAHGAAYRPATLPGFVAQDSKRNHLGLATYLVQELGCELVSLDSLREGVGIGSALLEAVRQVAVQAGCSKLWCITTNDNQPAIKFYQERGFGIVAVHLNAVQQSRVLKPSIPLLGIAGIPIRDEIELELNVASGPRDRSSS